jgi:predicted nucleic acid binding AN1-type Zn finger protein
MENRESMPESSFQANTPLVLPAYPTTEIPELNLQDTKEKGTAPPPSKRCACCRKKLMITDFSCGKCSIRHCGEHRLPEQHACPFDFKTAGRAQLMKQNPTVQGKKMEMI